MPQFSTWEILLAWLPNSDGSAPNYPHPCIYLGDSTKKPGCIIVVGITSDLRHHTEGQSCEIPWAAGKHPVTGLDRASLAQTNWIHHIPLDSVTKVIGFTPDAQQHEIAEQLRRRSTRRP